jgi:hypothetical protein
MGNLSATPQNELLGALARALRTGKDALNYPGKLPESVPLVGGMGAGDLMFGKGPELMEDMSYGSPPYKGAGWATKVDPRTVDLAAAPGLGTLASTALRGGKAAVKAAPAMVTNEGRRNFMKQAAGLGAGAAAASVAPDALVNALRAAPAVAAKEVLPAAGVQAARAWTPAMIAPALNRIGKHIVGDPMDYDDDVHKAFVDRYKTPEDFEREISSFEFSPDSIYKGLDEDAANARRDLLGEVEEILYDSDMDIESIVMSGKIPEELAAKGVTKDMLDEILWESRMGESIEGDLFQLMLDKFYEKN